MRIGPVVGPLFASLVVVASARADAGDLDGSGPPDATGAADAMLPRAVAQFEAGHFAAALPDLLRVRTARPRDADVALLLGITLHRLGRSGEAEPLLVEAAASPDEETRASARIFLGLIARDRGDADAARVHLEIAARSTAPSLADAGHALQRSVSPSLLSLTALVRPEFDSNVPLLPGTAVAGSGSSDRADGDLLVLAAIALRPLRSIGLSLDETASYRQQLRLADYDLFANLLGARYTWLGAHDRVLLRYGFELTTLGGSLYALGHLAQASYRRALAGDLGAVVGYAFHYRDYQPPDYQPFTGPAHTGSIGLAWGVPERRFEAELRYLVLREDAGDHAYSATGMGASLYARGRLVERVSVAVSGSSIHREFDAPSARSDWQLYGDLSLSYDVVSHLCLIAGLSALRNISTEKDDFDYLKVTAHVGVAAAWAGL